MRISVLFLMVFFLGACSSKKDFSEKLWYNQPAENWFEALPLGNGRLGAMVFGEVNKAHLQLNEESLWAGCPEDPYPEDVDIHYLKFQKLNLEGKFQEAYEYAMNNLVAYPTSIRSYQPLGDLYFTFNHENPTNYRRALDLSSGSVVVEYEIDGNRYKRETFISSDYDVLVYHFESLDQHPADCDISFRRHKDVAVANKDNEILIDGQIFDDPNGYDDNQGGSGKGGKHMKFAGHARVILEDGTIAATDSSLIVTGSSAFTILFGATTNYNIDQLNFDEQVDFQAKLKKQISNASKANYQSIRRSHIQEHSALYNRVRLDLSGITRDSIPTDERLEKVKNGADDPYLAQLLFQYGRYLLMGSSGGKAVLPANLQGIWNKDMWAAWESDFHLNINLQMNYWPADVCNLSETVEPLSHYLQNLAKRGQITARNYINSDGWVAHHVANPFGRTTPSGSNANSQITNGYSFPLAGAWMAMTLWRHYEFTQNREYLEQTAYPVLKGSARFILDF